MKKIIVMIFLIAPSLSFGMGGRSVQLNKGATFKVKNFGTTYVSKADYKKHSCGLFSTHESINKEFLDWIKYNIKDRCKSKKGKILKKDTVFLTGPFAKSNHDSEDNCETIDGKTFCSNGCRLIKGEVFCEEKEPTKTKYYCEAKGNAKVKCL